MSLFPDATTFIKLGPLAIKWYAICILTGALLAFWFIKQNFKKKGYPLSLAEDLFLGCLLAGIFGARLWYVLFSNPSDYFADPMKILNFQEGGLAIHGGLIFGALYAYFFLKKKGYDFISLTDETLYSVLLAQAIGRWGNFINKEAFGPVIPNDSLNFLPKFIQEGMMIDGQLRMPMFLIESVLNLIGFVLIHFVLRKVSQPKRGDLSYAYLMWYGVVRFFVEIFRTDALLVGGNGLKIAQIISILFIVVGMLGYLGVFRKFHQPPKPTLIFDFDGTLLDSQDAIIHTFKEVFSEVELKHEMTQEDYDWLVGPRLEDSFNRFVVNPDVEQLVANYKAKMKINHQTMVKAIPHAPEVIRSLHQQGYKIGIISNKKTDMIFLGLDQIGLRNEIDLVVGFDLVEKGKPDPEGVKLIVKQLKGTYDNLIVIGDSVDDVMVGHNSQAYTVAFVSNLKREQQLRDAQPNAMIYSLTELEPLIKEKKIWNKFTI